jgi:hypothetical protein
MPDDPDSSDRITRSPSVPSIHGHDLMGHSSYKTTEKHYARWIDDPLRLLHRQTAEAISSRASDT